LPRIVLDLLRLTHLPVDLILYGSYVLLFALLPVLLFFWLRPAFGTRGALVAGIFLIASPVLYNAYWFMLYKNAFALNLILLAFIALERRKWLLVFLLDVAIALSHTTSAIVYLTTLGLLFLISRGRRFEIGGHGILTASVFALVNMPHVHQATVALPTALFLEWPQYLSFMLPLLVLVIFAAKELRFSPLPKTLLAFAVASFLFPILHLPFYQRIFVFCDVALAAFAGFAAVLLLRKIDLRNLTLSMYVPGAVLCIAIGIFFGSTYSQVHALQPLLSPLEMRQIQAAGEMVPEDAFILTSAEEAPWYEGWTRAHIAAPGLLHDTHNFEEWETFWNATSTDERIRFLASFPPPLYVSTTQPFHELIGTPPACFELVAENLLIDRCDRNPR
jgi:hypothetical protein